MMGATVAGGSDGISGLLALLTDPNAVAERKAELERIQSQIAVSQKAAEAKTEQAERDRIAADGAMREAARVTADAAERLSEVVRRETEIEAVSARLEQELSSLSGEKQKFSGIQADFNTRLASLKALLQSY